MADDYRKGIAPFGPQEFVCGCQVRPRACSLASCDRPPVTRQVLLEQLFQLVWNDIGTFDSYDEPSYALISYNDLGRIEDLCVQIEDTP